MLCVRFLILASLLVGATISPAAAELAACRGRNVFDELKAEDAKTARDVRATADATPNARAVLWRIERADRPDRPASYLLGTMHLSDDRIVAMSPAIKAALSGVRRVVLEVEDLSPERVGEAIGALGEDILLPDNARIDAHLTAAETAKAKMLLTRAGLPDEVAARVQPWVAQMLLGITACERDRVSSGARSLDAMLQRMAEEQGVTVLGLESVEGQLRALAGVPADDQIALLKIALALHERTDDITETMIQLYLRRDIGAIWPLQLALAAKAGGSMAAFDSFEKALVTTRNRVMRDRANGHLQGGGILIAVGVLHLPGKAGLVELLREIGYTVTAIE